MYVDVVVVLLLVELSHQVQLKKCWNNIFEAETVTCYCTQLHFKEILNFECFCCIEKATMYNILHYIPISNVFMCVIHTIFSKYVRYIQLSLNSVYFGDGRQLPLLLFKSLVLAMKTCQMLIVTADMSKRNIFWLNLSLGIHI